MEQEQKGEINRPSAIVRMFKRLARILRAIKSWLRGRGYFRPEENKSTLMNLEDVFPGDIAVVRERIAVLPSNERSHERVLNELQREIGAKALQQGAKDRIGF